MTGADGKEDGVYLRRAKIETNSELERRHWLRRRLTAALAVLVLVPASFVGFTVSSQPANAVGLYFSQQLEIFSYRASAVCVDGANQNNVWVGRCFNLPGYQTNLGGWWWENGSPVFLSWYDSNGYWLGDTTVYTTWAAWSPWYPVWY